jgi:hypothetical protein
MALQSLDLTNVAADLKNYSRKFNGTIYESLLRDGYYFKSFATRYFGNDEIVLTSARLKDIVKPGGVNGTSGTGFSPTLQPVELRNRTLKLRKFKVDLLISIEDIEQLWAMYLTEVETAARTGAMQIPSFAEKFYAEMVIKKASDEVGTAYFNGIYNAAAVTPTKLDAVDGLKKIFLDASGAANGVPNDNIGTYTAITNLNAVAEIKKVYEKCLTNNPEYAGVPLELHMSALTAYKYNENYAALYGTANRPAAQQYMQDELEIAPNVKIIKHNFWGASSGLLLTKPGNLAWGTDSEGRFSDIRVQEFDRVIKVMMDWKLGFDFALGTEVWMNDPTSW